MFVEVAQVSQLLQLKPEWNLVLLQA